MAISWVNTGSYTDLSDLPPPGVNALTGGESMAATNTVSDQSPAMSAPGSDSESETASEVTTPALEFSNSTQIGPATDGKPQASGQARRSRAARAGLGIPEAAEDRAEAGEMMAGNKAVHGPVPDSPHVVTASPSAGGPPQQDWDSSDKAPVGRWDSVESGSGPMDLAGNATSVFEDGPGRWKQT